MRVRATLAALLMLAASPALAQGPRILSEALLGSGGAEGLAVLEDGGVVVAGKSPAGPRIARLDRRLRVAEDFTLPGSDARPRAVAALPGAVAMAAGPDDPPEFERGIALWRLQLDGRGKLRQDWLRRFRRTALDGVAGLVPLEDGGMVVTGWSGEAAWILRIDSDGETAWRRLAVPAGDEGSFAARAATRAPNGDILVAAYGAPGPGQPGGVWVLRFDLAGKDYAQKVVDELPDEHPTALAGFADGAFALGGWASQAEGPRGAWVAKVDPLGALAWQRSWPEGEIRALAALEDGGVLAVGSMGGQAWLARLDPSGQSRWERKLGGGALAAVALTPDGGAVAAGTRGRSQMWVIRLGL